MATKALARREAELFAPIAAAAALPDGVQISMVGLRFTEEITYEDWQEVGRKLGHVHRWSSWALADWINWGEDAFGEEAMQAADVDPVDRYDVARRVTGLAPGTLYNIASIGLRVAIDRRRVELPFSTHEAVAGLDPEEQTRWLQHAVDEGLTKSQLVAAIKGERAGGGAQVLDRPLDGLTAADRIEEAARRVFHQGQPDGQGGAHVPANAWAQLASALGEE